MRKSWHASDGTDAADADGDASLDADADVDVPTYDGIDDLDGAATVTLSSS